MRRERKLAVAEALETRLNLSATVFEHGSMCNYPLA